MLVLSYETFMLALVSEINKINFYPELFTGAALYNREQNLSLFVEHTRCNFNNSSVPPERTDQVHCFRDA